MEEYYDTYVKE